SASGSEPGKSGTRQPSASARMSVGRNGREAGIVKTRGITVLGRAGQDRGLRLGDRARGADVNPYPVETQSMQAARGRSAREQKVQRERAVRRTLQTGG